MKHQQVEVSKAVYYAREAKRYQNKVVHQFGLSLELFQEDGVHVKFQFPLYQPSVGDELIAQEQIRKLEMALDALNPEETVDP